MLQCLLVFFSVVIPLSNASIVLSKTLFVHFPLPLIGRVLLTFVAKLCVDVGACWIFSLFALDYPSAPFMCM